VLTARQCKVTGQGGLGWRHACVRPSCILHGDTHRR